MIKYIQDRMVINLLKGDLLLKNFNTSELCREDFKWFCYTVCLGLMSHYFKDLTAGDSDKEWVYSNPSFVPYLTPLAMKNVYDILKLMKVFSNEVNRVVL